MQILVSTGAIRKRGGKPYTEFKEYKRILDCDGFEFMMDRDWYECIDKIVDFFRTNDIYTPTFHCTKSIGEGFNKGGAEDIKDSIEKYRINARMARDLGATKMVMHLWDGITSDANFDNNIREYKAVKEISDEYGLDLLIENVVCNHRTPMENWVTLVKEYPDIHFVFDTKMAAFHGELELLYAKEYEWLWRDGHIKHYHVNDYAGGIKDWANLKTLPIGAGHVDFNRFFGFLKLIGYDDTITLEATACDAAGEVNLEMIKKQIADVKSILKEG